MIAGARRFDGRIQRQQIGLFGNRTDGHHDRADAGGMAMQLINHSGGHAHFFSQLTDRVLTLHHLLTTIMADAHGATGFGGGFIGAGGNLMGGGGHFGYRGGHHGDFTLLHVDTLSSLLRAGGSMCRLIVQAVSNIAHLQQDIL